jgi:hypothetical protein
MLTLYKNKKEDNMKKIILLLVLYCTANVLQAQNNITAAEFFVDTDPGAGSATPITVTTPGSTVNFTANIPTTLLANGFHFAAIRTRTDNGKWSLLEARGFYISTATSNVTDISAAEFFVDTDPGVGNGTPVTITSGPNPTFVATVPTTSLSAGFHFVAIRTKDLNNKWSLFEARGFYISASTTNVPNISAAEFFVDTDPGVGNGTAVTITPGPNPTFVATVPTTSLTPGFHFAAIRIRDASGKWGLFENRGFYISTSTTNVPNISAAEFFVDSDPGVGNGTAVTITPGPNPIFVATVPTTSLTTGFHFAAIRTRDASGKWGLFESRGFYISTQTSNVSNMVQAEYFIDADPGVGNASPFTIPNAANFSQNFSLNVPAGTSNGTHTIAVRVRNAEGKWGLFEFANFTVSGIVPLRLLSFDAFKNDNKVKLNWKTDNEINTSHFDVERSVNGIDFKKIGTVTALNRSGINQYSFEDISPADGTNLYRLRQVDIDAKFEYSNTVKILFSSKLNITVYPNPVVDKLKIQIPGSSLKWMSSIYDASGKLVYQQMNIASGTLLQINIITLPKGNYTILLNNGLETFSSKFIKQ